MKIRELMRQLEGCDPEARAWFVNDEDRMVDYGVTSLRQIRTSVLYGDCDGVCFFLERYAPELKHTSEVLRRIWAEKESNL